jgi:hypothetical protein
MMGHCIPSYLLVKLMREKLGETRSLCLECLRTFRLHNIDGADARTLHRHDMSSRPTKELRC